MNTERLFAVLSSIHPLSHEFRTAIEKSLTPLSLPKNYLLLEAPKVAEHAYFLEDGFVMSYTFIKGRKHIESFWTGGQIMVSARSFFEQVPAQEYMQVMINSEVFCISHKSVHQLFELFPEAHLMYRVIMNQYYENSRARIRDMHYLTAEERYKKFITTFLMVEQYISQEHIASYLGITPQSLSRIKRKKRSS